MSALLEMGGPLMWVLLVLSIYGLAVVIERLLYFRRSRLRIGDLLCGLTNLVRKGAYAEALHEASRAPGPVARVAEAALSNHEMDRDALKTVVQEAGQLQLASLERNIPGLLAVGMVAPMIGIMASLLALMKGFQAGETLSHSEFVDLSNACLVPSAVGLAIGMAAALFYMLLASLARRGMRELEEGGIVVVNLLSNTSQLACAGEEGER